MKHNIKLLIFLILLGFANTLNTGCSKILQENPYTVFTPGYFQTSAGVNAGIAALYNGVRWNYGPQGSLALNLAGTDEWAMGDQAISGAAGDVLAISNYTLSSSNGQLLSIWNFNFSNINLANGLIQYAPKAQLSPTATVLAIAQAKFLRGLFYLNLVQQYGAVPTDLGSGDTTFNQTAFQGFNRLPLASVLAKDYAVMISDFTYASQNLQVARNAGNFVLSQAAAYFMLAKTYLYRAYSTAAQSTDFANALTAAQQVINNQGMYGCSLLQNYAMVNAVGNEYNSEVLFGAERLDQAGNYAQNDDASGSIGGNQGVDAANDFAPNYQNGVKLPDSLGSTGGIGYRTNLYGRPIRRWCPTAWLFDTAFADKTNDSRYNNTFQTVWQFITPGSGYSATFPDGFASTSARGKVFYNLNDTAFVLCNTNKIADSLNQIPKPYRAIAPREFYVIGASWGGQFHNTEDIYPALKKFQDPNKSIPNDPGQRTFPVAKLSDLYLMAAEAAMQTGNNGLAAQYINVIRERAFYGSVSYNLGLSASVMDITAAQVNLDFILDERTRELCGENMRWPDLAMRGKLIARVQAHNPDGAMNIQPFHVLRPIPLSQLNAVATGNAEQYQNPGY